jgi:hypothetical protein
MLNVFFFGFPKLPQIRLYSYSLILPFDAIQPETLTALLRGKQTNRQTNK